MLSSRVPLSRISFFAVVAIFSGLVIAAGLIPANEALAASIVVDEDEDELQFSKGDNDCSLREAIVAANENIEVDGCDAGSAIGTDVITLPAGLYELAIAGEGEDDSYQGDLDVTEDLSIAGTQSAGLGPVIDAGGSIDTTQDCFEPGTGSPGIDRVLHVHEPQQSTNTVTTQGVEPAVDFSLSNVTVQGGAVHFFPEGGGGLLAQNSALDLSNVVITDNLATLESEFSLVQGGGLSLISGSTLEMTNSVVEGNALFGFGASGGGIAAGNPSVAAPSEQGLRNAAEDDGEFENTELGGPQIFEITIDKTRIDDNLVCGALSFGGGIASFAHTSLTNTDLDGNRAEGFATASGGGADLGAGIAQFFGSTAGPTSVFSRGTVQNNEAISYGDSSFLGGSPEYAAGGGINGGGAVTLARLSVENNTAFGEDTDPEVPVAAFGGGVGHSRGSLVLNRSTLSGNVSSAVGQPLERTSAEFGGQTENGNAEGGGLSIDSSVTVIENSTVSDNRSFTGGGISVFSQGESDPGVQGVTGPPVNIGYTTVTNNFATGKNPGGLRTQRPPDGGEVSLFATIIANQQQGNDCNDASESDMIQDNGKNIDSDGSCTDDPSSKTANPQLELLDDNGGPTLTHALKPNSPAIDEIGGKACINIDQRGENRPKNGDGAGDAKCDIGSFELEGQGPNPPKFCPGFKNDPRPQIVGTGAADTLNGTNKNEVICGQGGKDTINAGAGDDLVLGGFGDDNLKGQVGDDRIIASGGEDVVEGGVGSDRLRGFSGLDKLNGNDGEDHITGGIGNDVIEGDAGDDRLFGWENNDTVSGNQGSDIVFGSVGNDVLDGGIGADRVRGFLGHDDLFGRAGRDTLVGNNGNDDLDGGPDTDKCFGGNGTNTFVNCP